ncbi:MAG: nucleotide exchange factor GrpE [Candidatus Woykebacteria bacterium GWB1_45_5]|uniref:Protein GrpE n=2 Tax=Candidatus Woykeibacteriota TaxID=1817899 RepID=A0A1G1W0V4_9BACT|nr:MAG: nucleotide exchange factor GrpE [Candidatus Woykebacteria bacterium GWA1_44_8]OGY23681.1 MAG: nucleotide exchange factor GrpE [Candidatus Woykebacteria bacterium GWB1_45_5]
MSQASKEKEKIQHLEHQLKRALADYANLQKRVEAEREQTIRFGERTLLTKFLPVLDTLETVNKIAGKDSSNVRKGLELVLEQFKKILKEEGVEEIEAAGHFDPRVHEAVEIVAGKKDNKIVEVVGKGFQIGERVLRPAKVKVAKKQNNPLNVVV